MTIVGVAVLAAAPGPLLAQAKANGRATGPDGVQLAFVPPPQSPAATVLPALPPATADPAPVYPGTTTPAPPYPVQAHPNPAPVPQLYPDSRSPPGAYPYAPPPPPYYYAQPILGPKRLPYEDGQPVPVGYHVEKRARTGAVITGSIIFGATYLLSLSVAEDAGWLVLPVIGPWVKAAMLPRNACDRSTTYCSDYNDDLRFLLVADGIVQGVGAAVAIWGLSGRNVLIRNDIAQVTFTPGRVGSSGYGPVFSGRF